MTLLIDLVGKQFSRWTVLSRGPNSDAGQTRWFCRCACGTMGLVQAASLKRADGIGSCGCAKLELLIKRSTKHGHATNGISPTYHSWAGMKARCLDPHSTHYKYYGKKGVKVCDRWRNSFENFLADMGEKPRKRSLDRINTYGDYSPENCRWATPKEQASNKRKPL